MRYYKIINGNTVFYSDPLVANGMQIFNPSQEILESLGWSVYEEPESDEYNDIVYIPDDSVVIEKLKMLLKDEIINKSDEDALEIIELYPTWQSKIGKQVTVGERLYYNEKLWKVIQDHTIQEEWKPDISASLFVQVAKKSEAGTIDNPIVYSLNMELIEGKYYTENNITYLCTRSLSASYWNLSALVGQYVEIIN